MEKSEALGCQVDVKLRDSQALHAAGNKQMIKVTGLELSGCSLDTCDNVCTNI